jgi:DNA-binding GntR family transcriptional regulator
VKMVREDILNGHFVPGQRLIESALCDAYGVSRTVIREALRQL